MVSVETLAATAEIASDDGVVSRLVDRPAHVGSIWQDRHLVAWVVTGSEPVTVDGRRAGHRVTSRRATVDELRNELAGMPRLIAAIHADTASV